MIKIVASNIFFRGIAIAAQLATLIITNRLLLAEGRGIAATANTWALTFFTIFYCSLNVVLFNSINEQTHKKEEYISGVYSLSFLLGLMATGTAFLIYFIMPDLFKNIPKWVLFFNLFSIPFIVLQNNLWAIFQARHQYKNFNIAITLAPAALFIFSAVAIAGNRFSILNFSIITLLSWIAGAFFCIWKIGLPFHLKSVYVFDKSIRKKIGYAHLGSMIVFVINKADILIMNYFIGNSTTGMYFMASALVGYTLILPTSIQSILYTKLIGLSPGEEKNMIIRYAKISLIIMLASCIFLEIFANQVIALLGGNSFESAVFYLRLLMPFCVLISVTVIWSALWVTKGYFNKLTLISFITMLINIVLNLLLVPAFGAMGAVISYITGAVFIFFFHLYLIKGYINEPGFIKQLIPDKTDFTLFYSKAILLLKKHSFIK